MPDELTTPQPQDKVKRKHRKKEKRLFQGTDANLIQSHHVLRTHFLNYLPDFVAHDAAFDNPFAADWLALIAECEALPVDETHLGEQQGITEAMTVEIDKLIDVVADVEYYVNKAFPDDDDLHYEFQFHRVKRVDQYDLNFIVNCVVIRMLVDNFYEAELLAAGMPPTLLNDLDNQIDVASGLEMQHELAKRVRMQRARIRVKTLNRLYKTGEQVKKAAKIIYRKKPEVAGVFG